MVLTSNNHLRLPFTYILFRFGHIRNTVYILNIQICFTNPPPCQILIGIKSHLRTWCSILCLRTIRTVIISRINTSPITMWIHDIRQCVQIVPTQLVSCLLMFKISVICMYGQPRAECCIGWVQRPVCIKFWRKYSVNRHIHSRRFLQKSITESQITARAQHTTGSHHRKIYNNLFHTLSF